MISRVVLSLYLLGRYCLMTPSAPGGPAEPAVVVPDGEVYASIWILWVPTGTPPWLLALYLPSMIWAPGRWRGVVGRGNEMNRSYGDRFAVVVGGPRDDDTLRPTVAAAAAEKNCQQRQSSCREHSAWKHCEIHCSSRGARNHNLRREDLARKLREISIRGAVAGGQRRQHGLDDILRDERHAPVGQHEIAPARMIAGKARKVAAVAGRIASAGDGVGAVDAVRGVEEIIRCPEMALLRPYTRSRDLANHQGIARTILDVGNRAGHVSA